MWVIFNLITVSLGQLLPAYLLKNVLISYFATYSSRVSGMTYYLNYISILLTLGDMTYCYFSNAPVWAPVIYSPSLLEVKDGNGLESELHVWA